MWFIPFLFLFSQALRRVFSIFFFIIIWCIEYCRFVVIFLNLFLCNCDCIISKFIIAYSIKNFIC